MIADRFDAARTGAEVGAPSVRALEGLRSASSAEFNAEIAALVSFVDAFVSAERADSQHIENWPANVTDGVIAIESYVENNCG